MNKISAQLVGVELYFDDLEKAKHFYTETLGLKVMEEEPEHHAKFESGSGFVCLERKGLESYPSKDKAVLFFEVPDSGSSHQSYRKEPHRPIGGQMGGPARC